ncbi:MAG: alpha-L-glycero-D-manno-heptose alpha,3-glucosyltransferase [Polaromonas sp.]|nr:alpha-L-glycero-D-manno-heptose alpha,3-glucosyltransferase [Polaromonas sp.]
MMRQLAERMVSRGHEVLVATTKLANRNFTEHNGVQIIEFAIHGNNARGIHGEVDRYLKFVCDFDGDAIMIKAAQQWTFDALWPVLDRITTRKVFIPCGFSGLYEPMFNEYFKQLPAILKKFDHLIFYAERYRDIDFARAHDMTNFSVLPNGASEQEFDVALDPGFRARHGIGEDDFVFLTVGSLNGMKGHREIAEAFSRMKPARKNVTLILNGNQPPRPVADMNSKPLNAPALPKEDSALLRYRRRFAAITVRVSGLAYRSLGVLRREGFAGVRQRIVYLLQQRVRGGKLVAAPLPIHHWVEKANAQEPAKRVLLTDFGRDELVQAYMAADLFVFASNIEYSPLVLYETVAAGTPFLSVPVGNAEEIARWTGGGSIFPARRDDRGYVWVDPAELAVELRAWCAKKDELRKKGLAARQTWKEKFTWDKISRQYERILSAQAD